MTSALKLSVIVPVYKVEQYLPTLLDSILAQTYKDYELLLIDDGSPDGSGKICDDYAARDERVRVVHKENGGVSSARNRGIEEARGEYLYFCDSDDYIAPDLLEVLMREVGGRDFLHTGKLLPVARSEQNLDDVPRAKTVQCRCVADGIDGIKAGFDVFFSVLGSMCRCLFKRSIIVENNLRVDTRFYRGEDMIFLFHYYLYIRSAVSIDYQGYFYFQNEGSSIHDYRRIPEQDLIEEMERSWEAVEARFGIDGKITNLRNRWIHSEVYKNMMLYLMKGYYPESSAPRSERLRRWKTVRKDAWFAQMKNAYFWKSRPFKIVERCCRSGLFYLADPLLNLLGQRGKLRMNAMRAN